MTEFERNARRSELQRVYQSLQGLRMNADDIADSISSGVPHQVFLADQLQKLADVVKRVCTQTSEAILLMSKDDL